MLTTKEALKSWKKVDFGHSTKVGDVEILLEELLFDEQMYLAIYYKGELVNEKVVLKPGKK